MTKADLVEIVAERTGFTKSDVHVICDTLLDTIKEVMSEGNNIEIRRFGTFKLKVRRARVARNPRSGATVRIGERVVPTFKPSNEFKKMIRITPDELKRKEKSIKER
ncbi:integration host factor subunit beta [bacterium]|nr:integration host factor subunit beta [bacterium]RKZ33204.1 MAG: integration host factor subunit beta [bacterium]